MTSVPISFRDGLERHVRLGLLVAEGISLKSLLSSAPRDDKSQGSFSKH